MLEETKAAPGKFCFFFLLCSKSFCKTSSFLCTNQIKHLAAAVSHERCQGQSGCLFTGAYHEMALQFILSGDFFNCVEKRIGQQGILQSACTKIRATWWCSG